MRSGPVFALIAGFLLAQVPEVQLLTRMHTAVWDAVTVDVLGQPEVIKEYRIALAPASVDMNVGGAVPTVVVSVPATQLMLSTVSLLIPPITNGDYRIWGVAEDMAVNLSKWVSAPGTWRVDVVAPRAMVLRIEIREGTITVVPGNP